MSFAGVSLAGVAVAIFAVVALAMARTRVATSVAFTLVAVFGGVGVIAAGAFDAGLVLIGAGLVLALVVLAAADGVGEIAALVHRPALAPLVACSMCVLIVLLAWPGAPPAAPARAMRSTALGLERGGDLFVALATLAAVCMGISALSGFGARGVFGADKDDAQ